jgi:hypothetical protein
MRPDAVAAARRRSFELDERHGRALGSGRVRFRAVRPDEEPAVANPWTKKNPLLSLWLSGANAVAGKARSAGTAEAKRQQTSLVNPTVAAARA